MIYLLTFTGSYLSFAITEVYPLQATSMLLRWLLCIKTKLAHILWLLCLLCY
jgi:hypothetical protein